jgi:hypothetical protein
MEEWFIIHSFYHGLIHSAQEYIDAEVLSSLPKLRKLVN